MPVVARSLVNYSQTISGQTIPPYGQRTYGSSSSALTTAQTNKTVQLQTVADDSDTPATRGSFYLNVPLAGDTYSAEDDAETVVHKPAGTIATLTHNMPANPYDGQEHRVAFTATVTTLTMAAAGKTLNSALAAGAAGAFGAWRYRAADTTWYRIG